MMAPEADRDDIRWRAIFDAVPDAVLTVDGSQAIVNANPAAAAMFGWPLGKLVGAPLDRLIPVRWRDRHRDEVQRFARGHATPRPMGTQRDVTGLRADGTEFPIEASISNLAIDGTTLCMVILRDVSVRRAGEQALRASHATLQAALASMSDAVAISDAAGRLLTVNDAFARFHRFATQQECAAHLADFGALLGLFDENGAAIGAELWPMARALRGEIATDVEYRMRRKDSGETWHASCSFAPIHGEGNEIVGSVVSSRDISGRKLGEAALLSNEARLRNFLRMLPEAVVVNHHNRISFVNHAATRLLGATEAELLGRRADVLLPKGSLAAEQFRLAGLLAATPSIPPVEEILQRPDGSTRNVETIATLVGHGDDTAVLAIMRDITDLREAQEHLLQVHADLQRLLDAHDAVQEEERRRIARELHDDLLQSLAALRMDLAEATGALHHSPAQVEATLARMDACAVAALESTRRIVADLRPLALEELGLVDAITLLVASFGKRTGIAARFDSSGSLTPDCEPTSAVATSVYRIVQESLNNVEKHAGARDVLVSLRCGATGLLLTIHDNGCGMPMLERARLGSFGILGMRERARAIGGVLHLTSEQGAGTTVELRLDESSLRRSPPAAFGAPPAAPASKTSALPASATDAATQTAIDGMPDYTAVLDPRGLVRMVNGAWRRSASRSSDPALLRCAPGSDYLEACRRSALIDPSARKVMDGITGVLEGRQMSFVHDYLCDVPHVTRWFRMRATAMSNGDLLVTHRHLATTPSVGNADALSGPDGD